MLSGFDFHFDENEDFYDVRDIIRDALFESIVKEDTYSFNNLTPQQKDSFFNIFKTSYEKSVGTSWSKDKFFGRARNWIFFGDEAGFVAVRPQKSGFYKLVGVAGNIKGIIKGVEELQSKGYPVWGMVSDDIKSMAVKKGFKVPPKLLIKLMYKFIPKSVFGGVDFDINSDGSLTLKYADVGDAKKYFIGNPEYYKKLKRDVFPAMKEKISGLPSLALKALEKSLNETDVISEEVIEEDITSGSATVYHRTGKGGKSPIEGIASDGYRVGSGAMYGVGVYTTYDLESQLNPGMKGYGNIVIESKIISMDKFLIFDYDIAKKIYGNKNYTLDKQLRLILGNEILPALKGDENLQKIIESVNSVDYTSKAALELYQKYPHIIKKLRGIVFTGSRDGKVLISYDRGNIEPLRYTTDDGKAWTNIINKNIYQRIKGYSEEESDLQLQHIINKIQALRTTIQDDEMEYLISNIKNSEELVKTLLNINLTEKQFNMLSEGLKKLLVNKKSDFGFANIGVRGVNFELKDYEFGYLSQDGLIKYAVYRFNYKSGKESFLYSYAYKQLTPESKLKFIDIIINGDVEINDRDFEELTPEQKSKHVSNLLHKGVLFSEKKISSLNPEEKEEFLVNQFMNNPRKYGIRPDDFKDFSEENKMKMALQAKLGTITHDLISLIPDKGREVYLMRYIDTIKKYPTTGVDSFISAISAQIKLLGPESSKRVVDAKLDLVFNSEILKQAIEQKKVTKVFNDYEYSLLDKTQKRRFLNAFLSYNISFIEKLTDDENSLFYSGVLTPEDKANLARKQIQTYKERTDGLQYYSINKEVFDYLPQKEKRQYVIDRLNSGGQLKKYEFDFLSSNEANRYAALKVGTSRSRLEDFEIKALNNEQKKEYIDKLVSGNVFSINGKVGLSDEEFDLLPQELKDYYAVEIPKNKAFINLDKSLSKHVFDSLSPNARLMYMREKIKQPLGSLDYNEFQSLSQKQKDKYVIHRGKQGKGFVDFFGGDKQFIDSVSPGVVLEYLVKLLNSNSKNSNFDSYAYKKLREDDKKRYNKLILDKKDYIPIEVFDNLTNREKAEHILRVVKGEVKGEPSLSSNKYNDKLHPELKDFYASKAGKYGLDVGYTIRDKFSTKGLDEYAINSLLYLFKVLNKKIQPKRNEKTIDIAKRVIIPKQTFDKLSDEAKREYVRLKKYALELPEYKALSYDKRLYDIYNKLSPEEFELLDLKDKRSYVMRRFESGEIKTLSQEEFDLLSSDQKETYILSKFKDDNKFMPLSEKEFDYLSKNNQRAYVKSRIENAKKSFINFLLGYEFEVLTPEEKKEYVLKAFDEVMSGSRNLTNNSLMDYEFEILSPEQKKRYIEYRFENDREKDGAFHDYEYGLLSPEQKKKYLDERYNDLKTLTEKQLKDLPIEKQRDFVSRRFKGGKYFYATDYQFGLLSPEQRSEYAIKRANQRGKISDAQVNMLTPEARLEYLKILKNKGLLEARRIVRSVLRGIKQ